MPASDVAAGPSSFYNTGQGEKRSGSPGVEGRGGRHPCTKGSSTYPTDISPPHPAQLWALREDRGCGCSPPRREGVSLGNLKISRATEGPGGHNYLLGRDKF